MALAAISGRSPRSRPYTSHSRMPTLRTVNMPYDRSSADFVRQTLVSCGTNEQVVSVAAVRPSAVVASMRVPPLATALRRTQPRRRRALLLGRRLDPVERANARQLTLAEVAGAQRFERRLALRRAERGVRVDRRTLLPIGVHPSVPFGAASIEPGQA